MTRDEMITEHDRLVALFNDEEKNFPTREAAFDALDLIATYEILLLRTAPRAVREPVSA